MFYFPSTWRRLLAHFADRAYIFVLQLPVIVSVAFHYFTSDQLRVSWPYVVYFILVSLTYEILSLYFFSTTLGKHHWGLRVISREENKKLRLDQAILRVVTSRLSFFLGWSIFVLALGKYNRTHLADWLANTQVVSTMPRKHAPKIRWILALGLAFLFASESINSAAMTINSITWKKPFIYFQGKALKRMIDDITYTKENDEDQD